MARMSIDYVRCDGCFRRIPATDYPVSWLKVLADGGEWYFCRRVCVSSWLAKEDPRIRRNHPLGLTDGEILVLANLAIGKSNSEMAGILHIRESTVKNRLSDIFRKLRAHDRLQAVLHAYAVGVLDTDVMVAHIYETLDP